MKTKTITLRSTLNEKNLSQNIIKFLRTTDFKSQYVSISAKAYVKNNKILTTEGQGTKTILDDLSTQK